MALSDKNGLTEPEFLAAYKPGDYPRPSVTADIVLFARSKSIAQPSNESLIQSLSKNEYALQQYELLLIRRGGHPFLSRWALPGGFAEPGETVDTTASRELEEETGVKDIYLEQLGMFSTPGRDPRGWTITCAFLALANKHDLQVQAGDDAAEAAWFKMAITGNNEEGFLLKLSRENSNEVLSASFAAPLITTGSTLNDLLNSSHSATAAHSPAALTSDLAFDHADIIVCALQRLLQLESLGNTDLSHSMSDDHP